MNDTATLYTCKCIENSFIRKDYYYEKTLIINHDIIIILTTCPGLPSQYPNIKVHYLEY